MLNLDSVVMEKYALDFEKNNIGILLDIQGRLLGSLKDVNNNVYKVLSKY